MIRKYMIKEGLNDIELITYYSGEDLLKDRGDKDIIFLDVKLGEGVDGCSVAQALKKRNRKTIIFLLTGYREYTDDAFRIGVFRYIDKPLDEARIHKNLKEALDLYYTACGKIYIECKREVWSPYISDIIFIESNKRGVFIHTRNGTKYSSKSIEQWDKIIMEQKCFVRTHKSYIVNMHYITSINYDYICFEDYEECAYLTKRKSREFRKRYDMFLAHKKC